MAESFDDRYTEYQATRSALRKLVRKAYLASARSKLRGPALDFGCGVGELLATLPAGSMGLEYNRSTVAHCRGLGLNVEWYDGTADDWSMTAIPDSCRFESMIVSHVLEHLREPDEVLRKLLQAGTRFGIRRALVIVPGRAGFRIDQTHLTFMDREYLSQPSITQGTDWRLSRSGYFPGNLRVIGDVFSHHELQALFLAE